MENQTTVLIVDDEAGIRHVLDVSLTDIGYRVMTADSGESALARFREDRPDIVLADIKMAGMDGIALLREIKTESPDTEVIMMTGHGEAELAIQSLKLDAADFITKPINNDALEVALERAKEKIAIRRSLQQHTDNLEKLVAEQTAQLVETECRAAAGQVVDGLFDAVPLLAQQGSGAFDSFQDLPCYVSLHSPDLKIISVNRFYRDHIDDRSGMDSWGVYEGRAGTRESCPAAQTLRTGVGQRSVEVLHTRDAAVEVSVTTAPIRSGRNGIDMVLEIASEMVDVQDLHHDLQQTRRRYRELFDEVPCYITVQDRSLRLVDINRRFKEDFADRPGDFCYAVYKGRKEPCPDCPVLKTFHDGHSHQTEMVVTPRSGEQYNVLIWTAPIRNEAGDIEHVMEMSTNVTRMHELQDHLVSLGLMIGSVSHGIKGLLTGMDGGLYILDSGIAGENLADIREGRNIIQTSAERIKTAVLDILYYAKERHLDWESVRVREFAEDVSATIRGKLKGKAISFHMETSEELGHMESDPEAIRSALINILDNAIDACIGDDTKDFHSIVFSAFSDDEDVVFDITDNGVGMDVETLDRLFTLFFSTKGKKGTGLGLFITQKIIKQHGGRIAVTSKPGEGTHFRVVLPRTLPETAKLPPSGDDTSGP